MWSILTVTTLVADGAIVAVEVTFTDAEVVTAAGFAVGTAVVEIFAAGAGVTAGVATVAMTVVGTGVASVAEGVAVGVAGVTGGCVQPLSTASASRRTRRPITFFMKIECSCTIVKCILLFLPVFQA
jgi:hypothetical protein